MYVRANVMTPEQQRRAIRNLAIIVVGVVAVVYPITTGSAKLIGSMLGIYSYGAILIGVYWAVRNKRRSAALWFVLTGICGLTFVTIKAPWDVRQVIALGTFACLYAAMRAY